MVSKKMVCCFCGYEAQYAMIKKYNKKTLSRPQFVYTCNNNDQCSMFKLDQSPVYNYYNVIDDYSQYVFDIVMNKSLQGRHHLHPYQYAIPSFNGLKNVCDYSSGDNAFLKRTSPFCPPSSPLPLSKYFIDNISSDFILPSMRMQKEGISVIEKDTGLYALLIPSLCALSSMIITDIQKYGPKERNAIIRDYFQNNEEKQSLEGTMLWGQYWFLLQGIDIDIPSPLWNDEIFYIILEDRDEFILIERNTIGDILKKKGISPQTSLYSYRNKMTFDPRKAHFLPFLPPTKSNRFDYKTYLTRDDIPQQSIVKIWTK